MSLNHVCIYNKTRETFVATEAAVADGYLSRLIGLLGKTKRWAKLGRGLWIVPSRGVHTIGMLFPIDLIYLDKGKQVVYTDEYVKPFRVARVCLKATSVLEVPPYTIYKSGTRVGDQLEISRITGNHQPSPTAYANKETVSPNSQPNLVGRQPEPWVGARRNGAS